MITYKDVAEYEIHKFRVEASTLGLKPGEWPKFLQTTIGNGMSFLRATKKMDGEDILWVTYLQACGCLSLRVYND